MNDKKTIRGHLPEHPKVPDDENQAVIDQYDYLGNSCSATDCTGLIPSLPQSEDELASYNDVVQYMPPATANKNLANTPDTPEKK